MSSLLARQINFPAARLCFFIYINLCELGVYYRIITPIYNDPQKQPAGTLNCVWGFLRATGFIAHFCNQLVHVAGYYIVNERERAPTKKETQKSHATARHKAEPLQSLT